MSLIHQTTLSQLKGTFTKLETPHLHLVTASGDPLPITAHLLLPVVIGETSVLHNFVVVDSLVVPVILGVDFLQTHGVMLDFSTTPVKIDATKTPNVPLIQDASTAALYKAEQAEKMKRYPITVLQDIKDIEDECAIPLFNQEDVIELPQSSNPNLQHLLRQYQLLFRCSPGKTTLAQHYIPTHGSPVRVPPRRIPAHYKTQIQTQIQDMLNRGIIEESSSPWLAPVVIVPKKSGEIRLCVDYHQLNKKTTKDAYPLPLPDEVQDSLAGSAIFSTLDLQSGYWQMPVHEADIPKTAFCPGPGMGLFQFTRMPFGLTGAPSSFQRLMNRIFRDLPFVTTYIDDILVHSANEEQHKDHLQQVFQKLQESGLTLRGKKCHFGMTQVAYLGHLFSAKGMMPDSQKVNAVQTWEIPTSVTAVRQFIGLASYYRRYIQDFATIAAPLHNLTQKGISFKWTQECTDAFNLLKQKLTQAPILAFPNFSTEASSFVVYTDASSIGIGAVLEQDSHVIAYASRALTKSEKHYSVIQRECLAVVYALKQFRHYLIGRPFTLVTDHAPLQWLSAQKMEGLLCRWSLALQEYDFQIKYRKGTQNGNADALSRCMETQPVVPSAPTVVLPTYSVEQLKLAQEEDPILQQLLTALHKSSQRPNLRKWKTPPLRRYRQLWSQLKLANGIVYRRYSPGPLSDPLDVPIVPASLQQQFLFQNHNSATAGHQGPVKTLQRLRQEGYWVNMAKDVDLHCRECLECQKSKLPLPNKAPMVNMPVGRPWQMIAVDVLKVPPSTRNNKYLLVIQDYFSKWADAIPMPDQTAARIARELTKVFSVMGLPQVVHSDQGANFESTILKQTLQAYGITKSRTTAYHPQGDGMVERFNRSLLQLLRSYTQQEADWELHLPLALFAYRTAVHSSTGVSPFEMIFGRSSKPDSSSLQPSFDPSSYQAQLRAKLATLQDFVETHMVEKASAQKTLYDIHSTKRSFKAGDLVWLSQPTAGKLDSRWDGSWTVQSIHSPVTLQITNGKMVKVVHINRLRHRIQPTCLESTSSSTSTDHSWTPPQITHIELQHLSEPRRYPSRVRQQPDRFHS